MRVLTGVLMLAFVAIALPGYSVEPAYRGPLGNAEEPALRPYKWLYRGVKSFFYNTGDQLVDGNMHVPFVGSVQGLRGVRRGSVELGESLYRGGVYAPAPAADDYKRLGHLNTVIEDDMFLHNGSDFVFSWYFFPAQKAVDCYPLEGDTKVEMRKESARAIRAERAAAWEARKSIDPNESDVKRAQRGYVGDRADLGNTSKSDSYRGNLMKLAR